MNIQKNRIEILLVVLSAVLMIVSLALFWIWTRQMPDYQISMAKGFNMSAQKAFWWFFGFMLIMGALGAFSLPVKAAHGDIAKQVTQSGEFARQAKSEYVLEIIGLGVTLDKHRQGKIWEALKASSSHASIREQDPGKYPWSEKEKEEIEGLRTGDSLENGAYRTLVYWGVPAFAAESPASDPERPASPTDPLLGIVSGADVSGMAAHLFVAAGWEQAERPDRLLARVFDFFDEHPDVPYVVLSSSDGMYLRNLFRPKGTPSMIRNGHYIPPMPDSSMLFVLARRDRVEALRPFAFRDVDETQMRAGEANLKGYARKVWLAYMQLEETLPRFPGTLGRTPTVPEWLEAAKAFSKRGDIYHRQKSVFDKVFDPSGVQGPSPDFKPTPWFPIPWNEEQLSEFDRLPTLGFLHRPIFVPTVDEQGQPLTRRAARAAALAAGWQQALQTLPASERQAAPARVLAATGGDVEQTVALSTVLGAWAEQGGPQLDPSKPTQWVDTDARLGNTGAATWFMQMAIGAIASYRDGGASAAINLRDPREASIVFVTPPSAEKIQQQRRRGDVFRHHGTLAVDPANYGQ